jgi:hypothetical protein
MALELLKAKGDNEELGMHWSDTSIRYPALKTKFVSGLDKQRALAQDLVSITAWFELFRTTLSKYNIYINDVYNIDEKGALMARLRPLFQGKKRSSK